MDLLDALRECRRRGEAVVLCTVVSTRGSVPRHPGAKMLVRADGSIDGTVGGGEMEGRTIRAALQALESGEAGIVRFALQDPSSGDPGVCGGEVEIFLEPISAPHTLLVIGAGHVGRTLVHLGKWLGFRVVLSDDRAEHCTAESVPGADEYICAPVEELPRRFRFTSQTWIVMPTRGMALDVEGLPALLEMPHAYLGVIGSRRRWAAARKQLQERGVARTPEEIALSILAEIVMLRNKADGHPMGAHGDLDGEA
jgi:xanthine dehydrogenase accessory factor